MADQEANGHLYGTWKNLYNDSVLTLEAMGQGTLDGEACVYAATDSELTISGQEQDITLEITDHNGILRLVNRGAGWDLVPEAEAEAFAPVTVELTMDNWEEYFILKEVMSTGYTGAVMPEEGIPDFEIWMKPECIDRLVDTPTDDSMKLNVVFTFNYDAACYQHKSDSEGVPTFTFRDTPPANMVSMIPAPRECPLVDWRSYGMVANDDQCPVYAWGGWYSGMGDDTSGTTLYPVNPSVASVSGTITLLP
jgi:hypothetical protein